jgi:hypothetical protein
MGDRVGQKAAIRRSELIEQCLGLFEVGGVKVFGEPGVDRGEQCHRFLLPALLAAQAGEAHRAAQSPGLCVLLARAVDAFLDGRLGLAHRPGAGEKAWLFSRWSSASSGPPPIQGEISFPILQLKPDPNGPDILRF